MQSNQSNDRVSGRLTYLQNFLLVCLIFFISLLPIVYFWITTHLEQIRRIDSQIFGIEEELLLKNFFMQIEDHRLISRFYLAGNEAYLPKLRESESDIRETLSRIISLAEKNPDSSDEGTTLLQRIDPSKVLKTWQTLSEQTHSPLTIDRSEVLHTTLLQNLEVEFAFLTSRIGIRNAQEKADYALAENLSLRFPFLQENLSLFTLLETQTLLKKGSDEYEERILILLDRIEFDLDYLKKTIEAIRSRTPTLYNATVSDMWIRFYSSAIGLIDFSEAKRTAPLDLEKLLDRQKNSRAIGSALWEGSLNKLKEIFLNERTQVVRQLWSVSLLTLFLGSLAFILGILVTRRTNAGLVQLTQATESFTAGNLDARVPEEFDDEVGRQARAFNRMAQKLQEMLGFLYELLHATKELAAGNLKERLRSDRNNPEFDEVAESFNRMAAKFEEIIGKLQQMAMTLTRSAGEIEKTSQDEENSIVNQEKTTKDIAREANRIYSGAREFAKTIGEITVAADQTADLTQTAKESIHHIESIMHRMIDSSGHIAARLAILNAKAENITSIVTAITKVAERTNLLSLNASIEAEKAGEYGKGFAVIAREIRRLADQTAGSGLDIEKIVGEMMNAVASTVSGVQDFTAKIREGAEEIRSIGAGQTQVISRVQDFTSRFDQINRGMQIHSEGANEINRAIIRLTEKAGETTAAVHRLRSTIQELHNASGALHTLTHSLTKSPPEVQ